jgi:selenide,water dikinase
VDKLVRNSTARVGDVLFLTKPIGNGILVSANRAKKLFHRKPPLDDAIRWMTTLNRDAARLMVECGASAATDVTGYGLVGHLLEMCEGSGVGAELSVSAVPVLDGAREMLAKGFRPEGTMRNGKTFRDRVHLNVPESEFTLMCDAQTSGGLLIAIDPGKAARLEQRLRQSGLFYAKVGVLTADSGRITLNA